MWIELKGQLDYNLVKNAVNGIAVRKTNGTTELKLSTRFMLAQHDLSSLFTHYRIIK